jgi:hypothetical protein
MLTQNELRKDEKHYTFWKEGEITQCLTDASDRESSVNALKGKSPGFSGFVHLLIRLLADNGINEQTFSLMKGRNYSCATAHDFHMVPY